MFQNMPVQGNKQERQLLKAFKALDASNKESLIAFAEFLQSRASSKSNEKDDTTIESTVKEPLDIPRPEGESVIKAIKRLSATYPMVDKENILHPISDLMTSHMIQGKKANDVIDELEIVFKNEYNSLNNG